MQTAAEIIRIQQEVMSGFEWGDPRSTVDQNDANRATWEGVASDIAAMKAAGITPEIPFEVDLDLPPS